MDVRVDRRVELMSILFHLAGAEEYRSFETPYRSAVDIWFAPFREHAAVIACRQLRSRFGISYNAPIGLAVFLDKETLLPMVDLSGACELDSRWHNVPLRDYLDAVRTFAAEARVAEFLSGQAPYIAQVEQRIARAIVDEGIEDWFGRALLRPSDVTFVVVPGLLTGPWNYEAPTHDVCGRHVITAVTELEGVDAFGLPVPTRTTTELVVHEMAHAFVNPVVDRHESVLVPAAAPLYQRVRATMEQQRYGAAKIMIEESMVRVITVFFTRARLGAEAAAEIMQHDVAQGFTWNVDLARWCTGRPSPLDIEANVEALAQWFAERSSHSDS